MTRMTRKRLHPDTVIAGRHVVDHDAGVIAGRHVVDHDAGVTYYPVVSGDGRVGYRVATHDGTQETYIYFNPSTGSDDGVPNVFVYQGVANDPAVDACEDTHFVISFEEGD